MLLLLKLTLSPLFICGITLAIRKWGMGIGGWLASMPVNAGPILLFFAIEQGEEFAAGAAQFTLVSIIGVAAYCLNYTWMARRWHWSFCLLVSWLVFFLTVFALRDWAVALWPLLAVSAASVLVARRFLPHTKHMGAWPAATRWDLPLRLLAAIALILVLTYLAEWLGPRWSGLLTAFPIASTVIAGFAHARQGTDAAINFFRGMLGGMPGFCLFCAVLAISLVPFGTLTAFALALAAQLGAHGAGFWCGGVVLSRKVTEPEDGKV